jgi:hypothetical protein
MKSTSPLRHWACQPCLWFVVLAAPLRAEEAPPAQSPAIEQMLAAQDLVKQGKPDEAEAKLRAAILNPGVEPGHPALARLHLQLAGLCRERGKHAEAYAAAAAAVPLFEKTLGAENPFALSARWLAAREAFAAQQPGDAATHAAALLETLREYVTSGRAAGARWEEVPELRELLATMPPLNEAGIAAVTALLGRARAAAGDENQAAPVLKDAVERLQRLHGPGHPELVEASELLEKIAAKRGEALGRRYVGSLGFISKLEFEGNSVFSASTLRRALARDVSVVLASHPAADLADFLPVIASQLTRGFRRAGLPDATVTAVFEPQPDGGRIVVRIHEGPRYRMGAIVIEGTQTLDPETLRAKLLEKPGTPTTQALAGIVRETLGGYEQLLPQPETKATEELLESLNDQAPAAKLRMGTVNAGLDAEFDATSKPLQQFMATSSTATEPDWTPGEPVVFPDADAEPLLEAVRGHLAALGRPLARLHTAYARHENGTADLIIRLEDEGPPAVTGRIEVTGATVHNATEIIAAAGLKSGQPFVPELLDQALVALWNTGRFFPFAITPQPRVSESNEIDLAIQVREIAGVPPLSAKLPPEQESARRFICTLNEWAATGRFTDFLIASKADLEPAIRFGFSAADGLVGESSSKEAGLRVGASISRTDVRFKLSQEGRDSHLRLPLPADKLNARISLLPTKENDGKLEIGVLAGLKGSTDTTTHFAIRLAISPAVPLLKPDSFRLDGDQWVLITNDNEELLRFDLATALPVSGPATQVEFRNGVVREQQQALAAEMAKLGESEGVQSWIEAAATYLRLMGENQQTKEAGIAELDRWLRFASALAQPGTIKPFADLYAKWSAASADEESFYIPLDPALLQRSDLMSLVIGFGAITFSEMLAPPDSWVAKFSRELVFLQGGKTQYTTRTIEELLADPMIGPVGCTVIAQLLENYDAAAAGRFLQKALAQATAEGFRHDWQLVLNSPLGLGRAAEEALAALATIPAGKEQELAALLETGHAAWFRGFLSRLRERPASGDFGAWITPTMDELWDQVLGEAFRRDLEQRLHPAVDPQEVIAVVNGQPIPRVWVNFVEQVNPNLIDVGLPPLAADPARPWTQRPALAKIIRMVLVAPFPKNLDPAKLDAAINQVTAGDAAKLAADTDAEWRKACGMTRRQIGMFAIQLQQMAAVIRPLAAKVPQPDPAELARWWEERAPQLGRQAHLHTFRTTAADGNFTQLAAATSLVRQSAAAVHDGLPFTLLSGAAAADEECGLKADCSREVLVMELKPEFAKALLPLKPGETSAVVQSGSTRWTAILVEWEKTPPPPLEKVREEVIGLWRTAQLVKAAERHLQPLEQSASIQLIEAPAGLETAANPAVFAAMLATSPDSLVARLAQCWQLAQAKDPGAAAALDALVADEALPAKFLAALAQALRAAGHPDLADRCKRP